jgi:hypothetical protein
MRFMVVVGAVAPKVDVFVAGVACVLLGTKLEEQPIKLRDLLCTMYDRKFRLKPGSSKCLKPQTDKYRTLREKVTKAEMSVLRAVAFDFVVDHPHRQLLRLFTGFEAGEQRDTQGNPVPLSPSQREKLALIKRDAFTLVSDSYRTPLLLRLPSLSLSAASLFASCSHHSLSPSHGWSALCSLVGVEERGIWCIVGDLRLLHEVEGGRGVKRKEGREREREREREGEGESAVPAVGSRQVVHEGRREREREWERGGWGWEGSGGGRWVGH